MYPTSYILHQKVLTFLKYFAYFAFSVLFTVSTQVGGVVFWGSFVVYRLFLKQKLQASRWRKWVKMGIFPVFYLFTTFAIVPNIAPLFGRVALPMFTRNHVRPVNMLTCVFNRNYVRPALKQAVENVAAKMSEKYDDCEIRYLDANMPFINGFPLIPHLSHSDGRKLDIAFFYIEKNTQMPTNQKPSWSGYGVFAGPRKGEFDRIAKCIGDGFWQYDYPKYMAFINRENDFELDETRTAEMTTYFNQENAIERMFIEPHLKSRLHLQNLQKIGLHGCKAVRHDDHLHIQIVKN